MVLDRGLRDVLSEQALAQAARIVLDQQPAGLGLEEFAVMARAMLLLAVRILQRAPERRGMRARQNGQRSQPLGLRVGHAPRHLATPIVTDEMKALPRVAR